MSWVPSVSIWQIHRDRDALCSGRRASDILAVSRRMLWPQQDCKPLVSTPCFLQRENHDPGFCNMKIMTLGWWLTSYKEVFCGHLERRPLLEMTSVQENRCRSSREERWPSSPHQSWRVLTLLPSNIFIFSRSFKDPPWGTSVVVQWIRIHLPLHGRGHKFDPWSGKMPHASRQLRPRVSTEPGCCDYWISRA